MRIAVTGVHGQVASSLRERCSAAGHQVIALGRPTLDLANPATAIRAVLEAAPDLVVSAAAYTAVDRAELEPDLAMTVNGTGAGKVAEAAARVGVPLIHISTDYVFDGAKSLPYLEDDRPAPLSVYGATKLAGERAVAAVLDDYAILRTSWIFSPFGSNFVKTMLKLAETREKARVVADQHGGPTSALDIADAILQIAPRMAGDSSSELRGVFHISPSGEAASWADLAEQVFRISEKHGRRPCKVERITAAEYAAPARRPMNSRLSGDKLRRVYGVSLPPWAESLDDCVRRLVAPVAAPAAQGVELRQTGRQR